MDPMTWVMLAVMVASIAITALTAKKPPGADPPAQFKNVKFPIADEGAPQIVVFGDVWLDDWQVLWVGNYRTEPIYGKSGKK